jgi:hypothetical protein
VIHIDNAGVLAVIAELQAAQAKITAEFNQVVMAPSKYLPFLKSSAHSVLSRFMTDDEKPALAAMVATITGSRITDGMTFEMSGSVGGAGGEPPGSGSLDAELVEKWVAEEKEKEASHGSDGQSRGDFYKGSTDRADRKGRAVGEPMSNKTIADRIVNISKHDKSYFFPKDGKHDSPNSLADYIAKHGGGTGGGGEGSGTGQDSGLTGIPEERLVELLTKVLDFWQAKLGARVQGVALEFLDKALRV